MNDDEIEKNIFKSGTKLFDKLDLFTVFHAAWLIEMYYLGVNSLVNVFISHDPNTVQLIPKIVSEYNETILNYFKNYSGFVFMMALAIFVCGAANFWVKFIPFFDKYKLISIYAGYGITCGIWMFVIYITYILYISISIGFLMTPILMFFIVEMLRKLGGIIEEKTGITFRNDY